MDGRPTATYPLAMTSREARAQARAAWPVRRHRLDDDGDDVLRDVPPAACVAMVWALTLDAWAASGQPIPTYARADAPGRVIRLADDAPRVADVLALERSGAPR